MEPEQWREIEGETRLRIVHILLDVELDASDVDQFTLAETGTMARQMLGEALDESDDLAFFEIAEGPDAGRRFHLPDDLEHGIVGGAPGCDVRVSGEDVVPRAAVVRFEHQGFQLETTGETTVQKNGHPVEEPTRLADGDRVVFDGCTLTFHDPLESHLLELEGLDDESRVESTDMPEPDRTPAERDGTSRSTPSPDSERRPADADAGPGDTAPTAEDRRRERKNRVDESGGRETASNEMDAERSSGWGLLEAALLTITLLFLGLVGGILAVTFGLV